MPGKEWKLRVEGRILNNEKEEDLLEGPSSKKFLNYFEKIRVEFPGGEYPAVEWVKAKNEKGSEFDCFELSRVYLKEHA